MTERQQNVINDWKTFICLKQKNIVTTIISGHDIFFYSSSS